MTVQKIIAVGENENTVFQSCRDGIHTDVFETICAFLNSRGGTILLGVDERGEVFGFKERAIPEIIRALHCVLQELQERADSTAAVNAGRNWSAEEEAQLLQEYGMGLPIETIARRHGRSVGAIETRLSELGQRDQIQFSMR